MNNEALLQQIQILTLFSIRILVIVSLTPVLSNRENPFFVRIALAVMTAFVIRNVVQYIIPVAKTIGEFLIFVTGEVLIGMVIGFFIQMTFAILGMFSEFFSTQMGLRAAQVMDPMTQDSTAVIGQIASIIVTLVFISSMSLQRMFYYGIAQSFIALKSYELFLYQGDNGSFLSFIFLGLTKLFEQSFIIALPLFISLLMVNIGLGFYGKVAPQMNLLILGIPLQIAVGLLIFLFLIPNIVNAIDIFLNVAFNYITTFLKEVKP